MRIAFNASIVDHVLSGLGVYTVNLLREIARIHDDLVVYTSCPEVCGVNPVGLRQISSRVQPSHGRRGHLQRLAWIQALLPFRLLADRASLLLSPVPEGMLLPSVPQVMVIHDLIPLRFRDSFPRHYHYFRYVLPAVIKQARAIIADSANTKQDLQEFYGVESTRIHIVPAGYDRSHYRRGIESAPVKRRCDLERYLLYVGNLLPHKNLRRLLRAFALIVTRVPHTLVIAGQKDPRYLPTLEAEVKALRLERRVAFLDYVATTELPALYTGAEATIFPSLYEGFGLPILEAMACGTPVIASHAGSLPEVTGDAAILIDPYNIKEMARAIEAVLSDPGMREVMKCKGMAQTESFSWRRTALLVLQVLQAVAG